MAINVEIPFLLIIYVKKEQLKCLHQWNEHLWIGLGQFWGLSGIINMQISCQICKLMAINVEIPFLFIISVKMNNWNVYINEININA